ncbi:MAG: carboxypeptidase-like regulatory domain-containing protein [Prevotella sp.]|nr:carboxypeptidase-like regulatory domain-containing protein [Prevotella sp.]
MKKTILITLVSILFCLNTGAQKVVYEIDGQTVENFDGKQLDGKTIKNYIIEQQPSAQTTIHKITTTDYVEQEKETTTATGGRISGQVVDEKGQPVIGAIVKIADTKRVKVTDQNGQFSFDWVNKGKLIVSYVGFEPKEVEFHEGDKLSITLKENGNVKDIIVVGQKGNEGNPETKSTKLDIEPLIIVDGEEYTGGLDNIKPEQIKNIDVFKVGGKAAIEMYGEKGKNGVIMIYTKEQTDSTVYIINGQRTPKAEFDKISPENIKEVTILKKGSEAATKLYPEAKNQDIIILTTK